MSTGSPEFCIAGLGVTAQGRHLGIPPWALRREALELALADRVPYAVAVVGLDEGPFFHTDIVGCAPSEVAIGSHVEVMCEEAAEGCVLPHFRPISANAP